jgi:hypothetical protein
VKITDQSRTGDVQVTFVEDEAGAFYVHWLALGKDFAMVFVGVSDLEECNRIHKFVLNSMARLDSNIGAAQGVSFTVN